MHHLPGRLRVKCPLLKNNAAEANRVAQQMEALQGVERCTVSLVTGSVLCRYDQSVTDSEMLLQRLHATLADARAAPARPSELPAIRMTSKSPHAAASPREGLGEKIASALLQHAVERALLMIVRAVL